MANYLPRTPESLEKAASAKALNNLLTKRQHLPGKSLKKRKRLLSELAAGKLKPMDVLKHVQELIDLGEPIMSIRKVAPKFKTPESSQLAAVVKRLHAAHGFEAMVYGFIGIPDEVLVQAGIKTAADEAAE